MPRPKSNLQNCNSALNFASEWRFSRRSAHISVGCFYHVTTPNRTRTCLCGAAYQEPGRIFKALFSNSHFDLWGSSQRFVEGEGGHELLPGGEDDVGGDGSQVAEKSGAGVDFGSGFLPRLIGEVGNCVAGERQEIENDEHRGKVVLPMAEIMLEVVTLGFEG